MICPNCSTENRAGAKFCDECGFRFSNEGIVDTAVLPPVEGEEEAEDASESEDYFATDEGYGEEDAESFEGAPEAEEEYGSYEAEVLAEEYPEDGAYAAEYEGDYPLDDEDPGEHENVGTGEYAPSDGYVVEGEDYDLSEYADDNAPFDELYGAAQEPIESLSGDDPYLTREFEAEKLVSSDYVKPENAWRTGSTMEMPRIDGSESPSARDFRAGESPKKKKHRGRIVAGVLIALLLILAAVAIGTYRMELWGGKSVPNVVGKTRVDATYILHDLHGFEVRTMEVKSDDTEGLVLMTDPASGGRAEAGSEVVIHVAVSRTIPEVIGLSEEEAQTELSSAGYVNVVVEKRKSDEPEGTVLAVTPEVGTKAKAAAQVKLFVAEPYVVLDVVGLSSEEAQAKLNNEGFATEVYSYYTEDLTPGTVVSTDPAAGTKLKSGERVIIYVAVSRGAELINASYGVIYPGASLSTNASAYTIDEVLDIQYTGNNTTSFVVNARPYASLLGEIVYGSSRTVTGYISWDDYNQVVSIYE